jgi:hypothetical protein
MTKTARALTSVSAGPSAGLLDTELGVENTANKHTWQWFLTPSSKHSHFKAMLIQSLAQAVSSHREGEKREHRPQRPFSAMMPMMPWHVAARAVDAPSSAPQSANHELRTHFTAELVQPQIGTAKSKIWTS